MTGRHWPAAWRRPVRSTHDRASASGILSGTSNRISRPSMDSRSTSTADCSSSRTSHHSEFGRITPLSSRFISSRLFTTRCSRWEPSWISPASCLEHFGVLSVRRQPQTIPGWRPRSRRAESLVRAKRNRAASCAGARNSCASWTWAARCSRALNCAVRLPTVSAIMK